MKKWKKEYEQIVVPEALKERMEETMKKASQEIGRASCRERVCLSV